MDDQRSAVFPVVSSVGNAEILLYWKKNEIDIYNNFGIKCENFKPFFLSCINYTQIRFLYLVLPWEGTAMQTFWLQFFLVIHLKRFSSEFCEYL